MKSFSKHPRASDYVQHFKDLVSISPNLSVVIYCRESGREQRRRKNLSDQEAELKNAMSASGVKVIRAFPAVASGWDADREVLQKAAKCAIRNDTILLAESTDRFIRSWNYSTDQAPDALPTKGEWRSLMRATKGATLATLLHPDTPWRKVRAYQTRRGLKEKCAKGGRPKKRKPGAIKERRQALLAQALHLRRSFPLSLRDIGGKLGVPYRTVCDWLHPFGLPLCGFKN